MKKVSIQKLSSIIRAVLPADFDVRGRLIYRIVSDAVLGGIYIEQSATATNVSYLWVFFQPLFVPSQNLSFNYGKRVSGNVGGGWDFTCPEEDWKALLETSLSIALAEQQQQLQTMCSVAACISSHNARNVRDLESEGYAWLLCGDPQKAYTSLARASESPGTQAWVVEIRERAKSVAKLLEDGMLQEAVQRLRTWTLETKQTLKLAE